MKLVNEQEVELKLGSGVERTGGFHVSSLIREVALRAGILKLSGGAPGDLETRFELGFIWEELLGKVLAERYGQRIGEVEVDGIKGSPDGLLSEDGSVQLQEYKATWKSKRKFTGGGILDNWLWMQQAKAYCYMLGVTRVSFFVWFVNGDYAPPAPSLPVQFDIEFTTQELEETWMMILGQKELEQSKGKTGE